MTTNCDLRTAPLFPVRDSVGQVNPVGLRELLVHAHDYADLAVAVPPAMAGMLRVLYTITARITGLDTATTADDWADRRRQVLKSGHLDPGDVDGYLDRHDGRWDLFHPARPWLQDPRLAEQAEAKSANALDPTRPGDNSPIWWRHTHRHRAPAIPVAQALQWLLLHHYYGSGGAGGVRRVNGTGDQYMSAGPLRSTVSFYPLGPSLFHTLVAGLPAPATVPNPTGVDVAPWEADQLHDPLSNPPAATWPAGLLVGQSRHALLLIPTATGDAVAGCYLTWAWKPRHPPLADPYTIQDRRADSEWMPRAAAVDRAVWRDVDALLVEHPNHQRPAILTGTLTLPDTVQDSLRVRAVGFDQDRKATNTAWITATTPPVLRYMDEHDPTRAAGAAALHQAAEDTAEELRKRLRTAYRALATGKAPTRRSPTREVPWLAPAERHYWPHAETLFWQRLRDADFTEPYRAYLRVALDALDTATRHDAHQPAVARELAKATRALHAFAAAKNPRPKENTTNGH